MHKYVQCGGVGGTVNLSTSYHQQSREYLLAAFHECDAARGMADLQENRSVCQECLGIS